MRLPVLSPFGAAAGVHSRIVARDFIERPLPPLRSTRFPAIVVAPVLVPDFRSNSWERRIGRASQRLSFAVDTRTKSRLRRPLKFRIGPDPI